MKTLTINENQARNIYPDASDSLKAILEDSFGKDFFQTRMITDRVKTFEDALAISGLE